MVPLPPPWWRLQELTMEGCVPLMAAKVIGLKRRLIQNCRKSRCTFAMQAAYFLGSFLRLLKIQPLVLAVSLPQR